MSRGEVAATVAREGQKGDLALVLSGGGARAAYQAGVMRGLARQIPGLRFPIITGVSAGAINATFLASYPGSFLQAAENLCELWSRLHVDGVFRLNLPAIARYFARWAARLAAGGMPSAPEVHGFVDTQPLHNTIQRGAATVDGELVGIQRNLDRGTLKAIALTALNYSTGQTVTWVQGSHIQPWTEPQHRTAGARLSVEHVMASAALPLFFPAIRLGDSWYGDGGIRLSTPLSPAIHLGATRILALSPRYEPSEEEANRHKVSGYPMPAQILGHLMDAVFLDVLDEDVRRLEHNNTLLAKLPLEERGSMRPVDIRVLRPSQDLAELAIAYEPRMPTALRYLTRSLGTRPGEPSDFLSMLMFEPDYLRTLSDLGEADAEARLGEVLELVADGFSGQPG